MDRPTRVPKPLGGGLTGAARLPAVLLFVVLAPFSAVTAQGTPEPAPSGNRVDYKIDARLDGDVREPKTVTGRVRATWTNGSGEAVSDLWFHLYLNAFSNNRSTHLVEARGRLGDVELEDGFGFSRVTSARVRYSDSREFEDVFATFRYRRPDDEREDDRTVFSLDLLRPVSSGQKLEIELEWESRLPRVRRRTGYKDDFLLVAQWFPKLGVYEAKRGWNCHQFHSSSEFYSDYGTYEVNLNLPVRFRHCVGASGVQDLERVESDRVHMRFIAPSPTDQERVDATGKRPLVHDFTWTADTRFIEVRRLFRFSDWAERFPGEIEKAKKAFGTDVGLTLRDVDVNILIHPEREDQADRHFQATCAALFFYGLWFGEYPYERVTVVDPAWGAGAAGGMEYPTLFTCGTRLFTTPDMYQPESVTVHEAGHQFWYGLVGNNEFEAAWLDEGLNSYTDSEVLWRVYGPRRHTTDFARIPIDGVPLLKAAETNRLLDVLSMREIPMPGMIPNLEPLPTSGFLDHWRDQPKLTYAQEWTDPRWHDRVRYLADPDSDPVDTNAWEYADRSSYRVNSYPRPAVVLRSLPAVIGYDSFMRGMRHFSTTWRYRHPYPEDFFASFAQGAGVDVSWYFRELFQSRGTVDWAVEVEQERRPHPVGFFQREGGDFIEETKPEDAGEDQRPWRIAVLLRKDGELALPLPVRLTFENGSTRDEIWKREEQQESAWRRIELESDSKLISVELDPASGYFIDGDMSNNRWYDESDELSPWRWGERVLSLAQRRLFFFQGIGG